MLKLDRGFCGIWSGVFVETGMHRVRLDPGDDFVEQGLGGRRAALNRNKRRFPFFGVQAFRQNQITTTTLRVSLARDDLRCEWW